MHLFCFGLGYSAEALARRLSARTGALAGTRTSVGAGAGAARGEACRVQGRCRFGGGAQAAGGDDACARQHSAGPRGRRGAAAFRDDAGGDARSRLGRLSLDRRRLRRLAGAMGRRDEPDAADRPSAACGACRPSVLGSTSARRRGGASRSSGSPASTGPAAASSIRCARARPAHRQAGPGVQPHPRRRCRPRARGRHRSAHGHRIYNVSDDEPAPPQDVVAYAAELLGLPVPPEIAYEAAGLKGMAASFWAECKRVGNARIKADLGVELMYPTYREGLQALAATRAATGAV